MKQYFQTLILLLALFMQTVSAQSVANPKVTYFHNDITGTAVAATDEKGEVIWREQRRAYGEIKVDPLKPKSLDEFSVGYTGHQADKESGLTYAKARYYNKAIGRFYAPDPIPFREDDLVSINRYAYAANNPYKFIDPTGMEGELTEQQKRIRAEKEANKAMIRAEMGGDYNIKKKKYVKKSKEVVKKGTEVVQTTFETGAGLIGAKASVGTTTKATTKASKSATEGASKGLAGLSRSQMKTALQSAQAAKKGSTAVGHALSKHAGRNPEIWGKMTGSMKTWNDQAMKHFREIIRGPGDFKKITSNGRDFLEKRLDDGRGVRLNMDHAFKTFID